MNPFTRTGSARRTIGGLWLCLALVLAAASIRAQSGSATVAATLTDSAVAAGEETQYQISVVNGRADQPPPAPAVPGLTFQYAGQSQNRQFNFNFGASSGATSTTIYAYSVRADKPGRYVIPGQGVPVGGAVLRTLPVTLIVQGEADGSTPPTQTATMELILSKKTAYVGESVPVELRALFGPDLNFEADPNVVLNGEGFSAQKFTPPRRGARVSEGVRYGAATYRGAVAGVKTGTLSIGPAETEPMVQPPRLRSGRARYGNDPFDDPFFSNGYGLRAMQPPRHVKLNAAPVNLEVLPLPPGQPAGFTGAVGQFRLTAEAATPQARAGDPVTVRLVLRGQGDFERATAPTLADGQGLRTYPPSAQFKADDEVGLSGAKTFEQVVIAEGSRDSLPGYRFSYFDPVDGKYVALDTPPVPVRITGTAPTPAPVAAGGAAAPTPTPAPRRAEDILHIRSDPGHPQNRAAFLPVYRRREFWAWQGVPTALALGAGLAAAARVRASDVNARRAAERQRQQAELHRALRQEATGRRDFYAAAARLAQLRAARGQPGDAPLTAAEICQARRLDPPAADAVQSIFHRRDELAYSGGPAALEPVPEAERQGVLAALETLSK